jgi:mRNA-degrading endonuclease RelE of RelBE toxin-antitoxin system
VTSSSTRAISTLPSTKPPDGESRDTVHPDDREFRILYAPQVALDVQRWGLDNTDFLPTLEEIFSDLETNPYQFPVKHDKLAGARAAEIHYRGDVWRIVFDVDDDFREVRILAIGEHDASYRAAERRR